MHIPRFCTLVSAVFLLAVLVFSCSKESKNPTDSGGTPSAGNFTLGQTAVRTVSVQPNQTVSDSATGLTLLFPEGGSGTIKTAPIVSSVSAPAPGEGCFIDYDRNNKVSLVFEPEEGDTYLVYGYGAAFGLSEDNLNGKSWVNIPPRKVSGGKVAFDLLMPFEVAGKAGQRKPTGYQGFNHYWIAHIKKGTPDDVKLKSYREAAARVCGYYLNEIPTAMENAARENITGSMQWNLSFGSDDYKAFFAYTHLTTINSYSISIDKSYTDPAVIAGHIAHETGHYLFHVIGGNSTYMTVYSQMPWDTSTHGIGDVNDRRKMYIEEPAYFADYLMNGNVGASVNPTEPKSFLYSGLNTPWKVDAPSIEGFGCAMLASLHRAADSIMDIYSTEKGKTRKVPVAGLKFPDIFSLMYQSPVPTNIDLLRERMLAYLTLAGKEKVFSPIMHGIGWSYTVKGKLVDNSGSPIANATIKSIYNDGVQAWEGGVASGQSGADGSFIIPWGVFGGKSALRVTNGPESAEVNIEIDWAKPTNAVIDLGSLAVDFTPPPVTITLEKKHPPVRLSYGDDQIADITMTASLTATGPGLEVSSDGYIYAALGGKVSARVTASYEEKIISTSGGKTGAMRYQVQKPKFKTDAYDVLVKYGSVQFTDQRSESELACEFVFTGVKDSTVGMNTFTSAEFDVYVEEEGSLVLISKGLGKAFYGPKFSFKAK
ncbi:MAG: carboxypeptidase-like regulatory domain-containing protein [Candidatus Latescibacterota bacterium]